ncbi:hypothetical protein BH10ACI3_BH10ACI3_15510 [soil metagenome]
MGELPYFPDLTNASIMPNQTAAAIPGKEIRNYFFNAIFVFCSIFIKL